ncbi:laminin subunit gamma-3-like [Melopsittacus undulatus]|uniref:laminin subunit gamma-3-like n=1 Tax=Melopsittacus undulatus TaxID=13146 RepID=UPI00146C21FF|nr:laminin subunit gamma-3-like [Melopsittacus undulatus]
MPVFENAAFGRAARPPTPGFTPGGVTACRWALATPAPCATAAMPATPPATITNASFLTDFHSQEESTWWQSQSMASASSTPTLSTSPSIWAKPYEITYVRLKFHTSRPRSFAIYKRSVPRGPGLPFQYYSASCEKTMGSGAAQYLRPGEDEQVPSALMSSATSPH